MKTKSKQFIGGILAVSEDLPSTDAFSHKADPVLEECRVKLEKLGTPFFLVALEPVEPTAEDFKAAGVDPEDAEAFGHKMAIRAELTNKQATAIMAAIIQTARMPAGVVLSMFDPEEIVKYVAVTLAEASAVVGARKKAEEEETVH